MKHESYIMFVNSIEFLNFCSSKNELIFIFPFCFNYELSLKVTCAFKQQRQGNKLTEMCSFPRYKNDEMFTVIVRYKYKGFESDI